MKDSHGELEDSLLDVIEVGPERSRLVPAVVLAVVVVAITGIAGYRLGYANGESVVVAQDRVLRAADSVAYHGRVSGGAITILVSRHRGEAIASIDGEVHAGPGKTFQVWAFYKADSQLQSTAVRDIRLSDANGSPQPLKSDMTACVAIAITVEPIGGSKHPTSDPILNLPLRP
ncbi:MAG TPA: anti-sigma factor [Microlunatus sp.]